MTRANPYPPSGFDGVGVNGTLLSAHLQWELRHYDQFIFTVTLLETVVALVFIFRGEQNYYTSGHVWEQNMWEMYLRQFPPLHIE